MTLGTTVQLFNFLNMFWQKPLLSLEQAIKLCKVSLKNAETAVVCAWQVTIIKLYLKRVSLLPSSLIFHCLPLYLSSWLKLLLLHVVANKEAKRKQLNQMVKGQEKYLT